MSCQFSGVQAILALACHQTFFHIYVKHGSISSHTVLGISQPNAACRATVGIKCDLQAFKLYKSSTEMIAAGCYAPN